MKLTTITFLSLTAVGLCAGDALAGGCCKTTCCFKQKLVCSQYNAFSPPCCYPYGGMFGHKCCLPNLHIPFNQGGCGGCGDAGGGCVGGQCQSLPPAGAPMPGGPTAYAPMMPYGMQQPMMPYGMQQPMMVMQPQMGYPMGMPMMQAPMGMQPQMAMQPPMGMPGPMGMGMQPPMMPAGYHPGYNGMVAPPGTMGTMYGQ